MSMPVQHHYPAVLVGQFGIPKPGKTKSRQRMVFVARRGVEGIFRQRAEVVGFDQANARPYDLLTHPDPGASIDDLWGPVEMRIPQLARNLRFYRASDGLGAELFLRALVPLVAQLMVRHPEFGSRYRQRVQLEANRLRGAPPILMSQDELNAARSIEYLSTCGLLLTCRWWLLSSLVPLVSSDLGFSGALARLDKGGVSGYVVPLSPNMAIMVNTGTANFEGPAAVHLELQQLSPDETLMANHGIAGWAPNAVFGRDEHTVRRAVEVWRGERSPFAHQVPTWIMGNRSAFELKDPVRYLRALHEAQTVFEPALPHQSFDECPHCRAHLQLITAAWGATAAFLRVK